MLVVSRGLRQDPFTHAAFGVVVACAEDGIVSSLLVGIVEIAMDVELYAFLESELIGTNGPIDLRLLSTVEAVDL